MIYSGLCSKKYSCWKKKLTKDGRKLYTVQLAMSLLDEKIAGLKISDLTENLLPLFEQRSFIEAWLEGFKENF